MGTRVRQALFHVIQEHSGKKNSSSFCLLLHNLVTTHPAELDAFLACYIGLPSLLSRHAQSVSYSTDPSTFTETTQAQLIMIIIIITVIRVNSIWLSGSIEPLLSRETRVQFSSVLWRRIEIRFVFLDTWRKLPRIQQYDLAVRVVI
jgi:hypothetical protein